MDNAKSPIFPWTLTEVIPKTKEKKQAIKNIFLLKSNGEEEKVKENLKGKEKEMIKLLENSQANILLQIFEQSYNLQKEFEIFRLNNEEPLNLKNFKLDKSKFIESTDRIYLVQYEGLEFCVKLIDNLKIREIKPYLSNLSLMNAVDSPSLIPIEFIKVDAVSFAEKKIQKFDLYYFFEKMESSLYSLLFQKKEKLTQSQKLKILVDIAKGLKHLEEIGCYNSNLSPHNILINKFL